MIPKIIHLCWLSGDEFPCEIARCLATWKETLREYKICLWGKLPNDISCFGDLQVEKMEFDVNSVLWTKQAFESKKYAFAADYIRLYALYNYGGIYLDSDVIVYKSFNDLLSLPYFVGHDQIRAIEAAVVGAQQGCCWIKEVLDSYSGKSFINSDGSFETLTMPCRIHHVLVEKGYRFFCLHSLINYVESPQCLYVFDGDFFNSRNAVEVRQTPKSYCAHNYAGSWTKKQTSCKEKIKKYIPKWLLRIIYFIGQNTWARNKYSWFQIPFEES